MRPVNEVVANPFDTTPDVPEDFTDPRVAAPLADVFDNLTSRTRELQVDRDAHEAQLDSTITRDAKLAAGAAITFGPPVFTNGGSITIHTPSQGDVLLVPAGRRLLARGSSTAWVNTSNGYTWTIMAGPSLSAPMIMFATEGLSGLPIVCVSTGSSTIRRSTDYGATWGDGGTASTGLTCGAHHAAFSSAPYMLAGTNKIYTDTDLAGGWTSRTVPGGWASEVPIQIVVAPEIDTAIIVPADLAGTAKVLFTVNGTGWAQSGALPSEANETVWGACWSSALGAFFLSAGTKCWRSVDGDTWTLQGDISGLAAMGRITAVHKTLIACGNNGDLPMYSIDEGVTWITFSDTAIGNCWHDVVTWDNRAVLGAHYDIPGTLLFPAVVTSSDDQLELRMSGRVLL